MRDHCLTFLLLASVHTTGCVVHTVAPPSPSSGPSAPSGKAHIVEAELEGRAPTRTVRLVFDRPMDPAWMTISEAEANHACYPESSYGYALQLCVDFNRGPLRGMHNMEVGGKVELVGEREVRIHTTLPIDRGDVVRLLLHETALGDHKSGIRGRLAVRAADGSAVVPHDAQLAFEAGRDLAITDIDTGPERVAWAAGHVGVSLEGKPHAGGRDAFVRALRGGKTTWHGQVGSAADEEVLAVAGRADGGACVAGWTEGDLARSNRGGRDAFVACFDAAGELAWRHQLGSASHDEARAIVVRPDGVFIAGGVRGSVDGETFSEKSGRGHALDPHDAFVAAFDLDGQRRWLRVFGTPRTAGRLGEDVAHALDVAPDGTIYVAGFTTEALHDQKKATAGEEAFVTAWSPGGGRRWTRLLGHDSEAFAVHALANGDVVVGGRRSNGLGFLSRWRRNGQRRWFQDLALEPGEPVLEVRAVTTGSQGLVVLAESSADAKIGLRAAAWVTMRVDPKTGVATGRSRISPEFDGASAATVDAERNVIQAGRSGEDGVVVALGDDRIRW